MNQKKDFLDELEQTLMLIMIVAATVLTLISFIAQFIAPDSVNLFKQLSFYTYGWMVFLALGPCVKRSAFMRIELLSGKYPQGLQNGLKMLGEILMFVMMIVMCVLSYRLTANTLASGASNAVAPGIPLVLAYAAPAVGYTLGVIAYIYKFATSGKGGNKECPQYSLLFSSVASLYCPCRLYCPFCFLLLPFRFLWVRIRHSAGCRLRRTRFPAR